MNNEFIRIPGGVNNPIDRNEGEEKPIINNRPEESDCESFCKCFTIFSLSTIAGIIIYIICNSNKRETTSEPDLSPYINGQITDLVVNTFNTTIGRP